MPDNNNNNQAAAELSGTLSRMQALLAEASKNRAELEELKKRR